MLASERAEIHGRKRTAWLAFAAQACWPARGQKPPLLNLGMVGLCRAGMLASERASDFERRGRDITAVSTQGPAWYQAWPCCAPKLLFDDRHRDQCDR